MDTTVFVYRLDLKSKAEIPLGTLVERRRREREGNNAAMLRMARKEFAKLGIDASSVFIRSDRPE
jgi:hypothetical protein